MKPIPKDLEPHILNEKNKYITEEFINNILQKYKIKHTIKNLQIFQLAFIHKSYMNKYIETDNNIKIIKDVAKINPDLIYKTMPLQNESYDKLEFKGDAIIHHILGDYMFDRFGTTNEGFMTKLRSKIENTLTLSIMARKLKFYEYFIISRNIELNNGRCNNMHIYEDVFEAFMGALSTEVSFKKCKKLFLKILENEIDITEIINTDTNYKDKLMQYFHVNKWGDPLYLNEDTTLNSDGKNIYTMIVYRKSVEKQIILGKGMGVSKKIAEQNAAKEALSKIKN